MAEPDFVHPLQALTLSHQAVRGHRTPHAYYISLAGLKEHLFRKVDVLGVVVSQVSLSPRDGHGFGDSRSRLHIVDRSISSEHLSLIIVEVRRWAEEALPQTGVGDVVILHEFRVVMQHRQPVLTSGPTSSWAVINRVRGVSMSGPPLEHGQTELNLAESLHQWWSCGA